MGESSLNEDNQIPICVPITTNSPVALSSSLSELDPMLNSRHSPFPSPIADEQIMTNISDEPIMANVPDEQVMSNSIDETSSLTETLQKEISLPADQQSASPIEKQLSVSVDDSLNTSEKNESSLSMSMSNGFNELSIEKKDDDLLQLTEEDPIELP